MRKASRAICTFIRNEEGTELVEWGLIAGLVIVLAAGIFATIGQDLNTVFGVLQGQTGTAATNAGAAGGAGP